MATWKTSWSRKIKLGWRKILWRTAKAKSETWSWKNEHTWSGPLWRPMEIRQIWRSGQNILHFWRLLSWPGKLTFSWIHYGWNVTKYNSNTLKFIQILFFNISNAMTVFLHLYLGKRWQTSWTGCYETGTFYEFNSLCVHWGMGQWTQIWIW